MYALMCYQMALLTECLMTYCAAIRANTTMYALMCCQMAILTECLITYCTAIRAITTMYALMFCQNALCTECLITYCTAIRVIKTMYVTRRSMFCTMHMKIFIQSILLKTERLTIRIYCDRKTIFIAMYTLSVSKSVAWYQNYVHTEVCLARRYIPRAWRKIKMAFLPAHILRLRHIVLLVYCRKWCKNW